MEEGGGEVGKSREVVQGSWRWRRGNMGELRGAFLTGKRGGGGEMLRAGERGVSRGEWNEEDEGILYRGEGGAGREGASRIPEKKIWEEASWCVAMAQKERTRGGRRR